MGDPVESGAFLRPWAESQPDVPAIVAPSGDRTFGELAAGANRLSRALRAAGLGSGDAVAVVCGNRAAFAEAVYASMQAGLRYSPVNWHFTADEIAYVVDDCRARAVIGDARHAAVIAAATARCPRVVARLAVGGPIDGFDDYDATLAAQDPSPLPDPEMGNRMLYTSGTTGHPKGVLRPPGYSTGLTALTTAPRYTAGDGHVNLCTGPLYHGGPLGYSLLAPLTAGVGVVMMERFDAAEALRLIEAHRITHTHMVPTMFHRLLRLPDEVRAAADVSSLCYVLHGGAACPIEVKAAIIEWFGPVVWEYYAATEGAGASISSEEWLERPGSVGRPSPGHVRIDDGAGGDRPTGVDGVICIRRDPAADFEYFGDPAKSEAARRGDHFTVGDIGHLDADGYLYVTDRGADLIVSGGVNVYPAAVEAALIGHPWVRDAGVVGVPDEEFGESVHAVIELEADAPRDAAVVEAELVGWCRERIARFTCPRSVAITDALPRLDNGKLYRHRLRDEARRAAQEDPHA